MPAVAVLWLVSALLGVVVEVFESLQEEQLEKRKQQAFRDYLAGLSESEMQEYLRRITIGTPPTKTKTKN